MFVSFNTESGDPGLYNEERPPHDGWWCVVYGTPGAGIGIRNNNGILIVTLRW